MYDLAIIGGGPAGLMAAIYAERYKLKSITIASKLGGKIEFAHSIENWPGDYLIYGDDLSNKFINHAKQMNVNLVEEKVLSIDSKDKYFNVSTASKKHKAKNIILAVGNEQNQLNIEGEKEFIKKGVSYKANKDGKYYKDQIVTVVGSGDSACTSALFLADIAKKVYLMYRSKDLKAEPLWVNKVKSNSKIKLLPGVIPTKIKGNDKVNKLICSDGSTLHSNAIFIEVGFSPPKYLFKNLDIKVDEDGFIIVDSNQKTSVKNVWAAGDITINSGKLRQIISAAAEGAVSAASVYNDINSDKQWF